MSKEKKSVVPSLRFPEFQDDGEWKVKRLGGLSQIVRGGSPRPITKYLTTNEDGLNWLKIGDVNQNAKYVTFTNEKVIKSALSKTREVNPGDLIMSNSMSFGRPYILKIKACIHDGWIAVTNISNDVWLEYLYYYILSPRGQSYFKDAAAGGGVKNLNADIIKQLTVCLPPQKEQQKIADCLSSLDEVIDFEAQKIEALKIHKKGLMQQLFPHKGETIPLLRFPEFQDAGKWEVKRLEQVYSFYPTNSFSRDKLSYESGTIKNIHYGDIHTKFAVLFDITKEQVPYLHPSMDIEKLNHEAYCKEGDIILADASEDIDDIGKSIEIVNLNSEKLVSGLHTIKARQKSPKLIVGFGGYLFRSAYIREQIKREAQGAKVLGISPKRLSKISVIYPSIKDEQQKIVDCLSSLDEVIDLQTQKLEVLKAHKKGLMQQLFPQEVD